MTTSINTIVQLKITGFKAFAKTDTKPAGVKLQSRFSKEEGGLGNFEIKCFGLNEADAKEIKGKSIELNECRVFRPEGDYAPSYWSSTGKPALLKESVDKPVINTMVAGKVEAIEPFAGEKFSGYSLFFIVTEGDTETVYAVKVVGMSENEAKAVLGKEVNIQQCKPLSKTSFITESKPALHKASA